MTSCTNAFLEIFYKLGIPGLLVGLWALYKSAVVPFRINLVERWMSNENLKRDNINKMCVNLLAKYYSRAVKSEPVSPEQVSELRQDSQELMVLSAGASSFLSELSFLLFRSLILIEKEYNESREGQSQYRSIRTTAIYSFYLNVLNDIQAEAQLSATYPSLFKILFGRDIKRKSKITKDFKKFILPSTLNSISFVEHSERLSPYSLETISFTESAISTRDAMVMVCAHRAIDRPGSIERLLYSRGIYFPSAIELPIMHLATNKIKFDLIGFAFEIELSDNTNLVRLYLCPEKPHQGLQPGIIDKEQNPEYLPTEDIVLDNVFSIGNAVRSISINDESNVLVYLIEEKKLRTLFEENKKSIQRHMISQLKKS